MSRALWLLFFVLFWFGCHEGDLGEPCHPDGTCDHGLVCARRYGAVGPWECEK